MTAELLVVAAAGTEPMISLPRLAVGSVAGAIAYRLRRSRHG